MYSNRSPYTTSPIKKTRQDQAVVAGKGNAVEDTELWRSRCNDLESSLCQANTDLELAHFRARKAAEGEERVSELLAINDRLSAENEILQRQTNQKKTESDIWRQKYETQMNNIVSLKSASDMELKRQAAEISRLQDELKQSEIDKVKEAEDVRYQVSSNSYDKTEALKKSHLENLALYEEQLKKLRNIVQDREREIAVLSSQVSLARNDGSQEACRFGEEREKLRVKVSELEVESMHELQILRSKLDQQSAAQLDSLKRLHDNELEVMAGESLKLRGLLDVKTKEIEALVDQNRGLKLNYDEDSQNLRNEINSLKERIVENNEFANKEIAQLQDQLHNMHATDIQGLQFHHDNQLGAVADEKQELQNIIQAKQAEIANQLREKQIVRDNLSREIDRLSDENEQWKLKYAALENIRNRESQEAAFKYDNLNLRQNEFAAAQSKQIDYLKQEIENLKQLLVAKNQEIDSNRSQQAEIRAGLEADLKNIFEELEDQKKEFANLRRSSDLAQEDLKLKIQVSESKANEQKKKLETTISYLQEDIQRLKDTIEIKEKEAQNHQRHRELQEREIKKLKNDWESQADHINQLERLKARELEELRAKLESQNNLVVESMKGSHQNQVDIMNTEINDLKHICTLKEGEVSDLLDKYERLESAIGEFKYNAEKLKEHQSSIQALGNEIINNKSIYDSYQKTRNSRYPTSATKLSNVFS